MARARVPGQVVRRIVLVREPIRRYGMLYRRIAGFAYEAVPAIVVYIDMNGIRAIGGFRSAFNIEVVEY